MLTVAQTMAPIKLVNDCIYKPYAKILFAGKSPTWRLRSPKCLNCRKMRSSREQASRRGYSRVIALHCVCVRRNGSDSQWRRQGEMASGAAETDTERV